jgi:hypothetical protein
MNLAHAVRVSWTGSGSGAIQSETQSGTTIRYEVYPEHQDFTGALIGTHDYTEPEIAIVNFQNLRGTYHATGQFVGTINGVQCTAIITQDGTINFANATFSGNWDIVSSSCGASGSGTVAGTLTFTSDTTYLIGTSWRGDVDF